MEKEKDLNILIVEKNREKIKKVLEDFQKSFRTRTIEVNYIFAMAKQLDKKLKKDFTRKELKSCFFDWMPDAGILPNAYKYKNSALATAVIFEFTGNYWKLKKVKREQVERPVINSYYSEIALKKINATDWIKFYENDIKLAEFPDLRTKEDIEKEEEKNKLRDETRNINLSEVKEYHDITLRIGPSSAGFLVACSCDFWGCVKNVKAFKTYLHGMTRIAHIIPKEIEIPGYYEMVFSTIYENLKIYGSDGDYVRFENKNGFEIYRAGIEGIIIRFM